MTQRFGDEWVINEAPDFNQRVEKLLPIRRWDSLAHALNWDLQHDPTLNALNINDRIWVTKLATDPSISVFYAIDFESREVELLDIRRKDAP